MSFKNHYDTLGVSQNATEAEIKQAYRKLSIKFHPDKNDGDSFLAEMFKNINEANAILSNPTQRKEYDILLNNLNQSFSKPYQEDHKSESQNQTSQDINQMFSLIKLFFDKEQAERNEYLGLLNAQYVPKPRYLTVTKLLWTILIMLGIYVIFKPSPEYSKSSDTEQTDLNTYDWVTIENAYVYSKPNIESSKIGNVPPNTGFISLRETNYFVKITFINKNGKEQNGFIWKKQLKKNE